MRRAALAMLAVVMVSLAACGQAGPSGLPASTTSRAPSLTAPASSSAAAPPALSSPAPSSPAPSSPAPSSSSPSSAPAQTPTLVPGMTGPAVLALQRRLAALMYYPGPADSQFGTDTLEAVWAFQEVQGLTVQDAVTAAMQRALADPRLPVALVPSGGSLRVEVNLSDEVLVLYRDNQVALISHVSSGGGYYFCSPGGGCGYAITPTGDFRTTVFMPGWITVPLGEMYNSVFFIDTTYAIHGDTYVPANPVSHGCVRIPMDIAAFFHTLVPTPGTPVYIRG